MNVKDESGGDMKRDSSRERSYLKRSESLRLGTVITHASKN